MEFFLGILAGVAVTLLVAVVGAWLVSRQAVAAPLPELPPFEGEPAVMVLLLEPFLNHQLRDALAQQAASDPQSSTDASNAPDAAPPKNLNSDASRFKMQLNDAQLDVQPGRRAKFYARLTFTAWQFSVAVRPVAEMRFGLHNGRVKIAVTQVQVAGLTVPRALIAGFVNQVMTGAEAKLNQSLRQLQQDTRVELAQIETTQDLMILKFAETAERG